MTNFQLPKKSVKVADAWKNVNKSKCRKCWRLWQNLKYHKHPWLFWVGYGRDQTRIMWFGCRTHVEVWTRILTNLALAIEIDRRSRGQRWRWFNNKANDRSSLDERNFSLDLTIAIFQRMKTSARLGKLMCYESRQCRKVNKWSLMKIAKGRETICNDKRIKSLNRITFFNTET